MADDPRCYYCQRDYGTLAELQCHLLAKHPGTYAAQRIANEEVPSGGD